MSAAMQETPCLRYPEALGMHRELTIEFAFNMLTRGISMAQTVPFSWGFIDKPADGTLLLLFVPPQNPFPNDGIRYLESEAKYTMPVGPPNTRELEIHEVKYGFVPGNPQETMASRIRRRFRFVKGGPTQLILVHYTRGPAAPIPPLANQAARAYPLPLINQPPVFVLGEKVGQKVYPPGASIHAGPAPGQPIPTGMMPFNPQAMVAQQNANMEMLERRRERERQREAATTRPRTEEDDSADETEQISTKTLAITRYRRNHELINEVFTYAALGNKSSPAPTAPYSIFNQSELESKIAKLQSEISVLQQGAAEREAAKSRAAAELLSSNSNFSLTLASSDTMAVT
ncbi:hypothetical protein AX14_000979 [Amanita brunnescens Koide BX004]|nr:hypothetical protein AX14_000979 [Amanita brunnescens Koide BX004]